MRAGFIGLGTMGMPMATRLHQAGHLNSACDVVPERGAALGLPVHRNAGEVAAACQVVFTSLPDEAALTQVLFGENGITSGATAGLYVVDVSTTTPDFARSAHAQLRGRGVIYVDAPVSGGPRGARAGTLGIMVGAEQDVFDAVQPLLATLGANVSNVGPVGSGQAVKLCNNLVVAATVAALAEGCRLMEDENVDISAAYKVLTSSSSESRQMRARFPLSGLDDTHPASHDFAPQFRLDLMAKDVRLAVESARRHGRALLTASTLLASYEAAVAADFGALDVSAIYRYLA